MLQELQTDYMLQEYLPAGIQIFRESDYRYVIPGWHQSIEVNCALTGHIDEFYVNGKPHTLTQEKLLVINAFEVHSVKSHKEDDFKALSLSYPYAFVKSHFPEIDEYYIAIEGIDGLDAKQKAAYSYIREKCLGIVKLYDEDSATKSIKVSVLLLEILDLLLTYFLVKREQSLALSRDDKAMQRLMDITDFVAKNYQGDISLDSLAERYFLSKEYLARFFKAHMGVTLGNYITAVRADKAREAIRLGRGKTFTEIAKSCGFSGLRTMDRALQKAYGMTARDIKKKLLQSDKSA